MNIDKWFAEKCGVHDGFKSCISWVYGINQYNYEWTISDPRCREIIREKFKTHTYWDTDMFVCHYSKNGITDKNSITDYGKTIAEAEIACLTAIYEAKRNLQKIREEYGI